MKRILVLLGFVLAVSFCFAEKIKLSKGTVITVSFAKSMTSQDTTTPRIVVMGDVYDDSGTYIIIKANTEVVVQLNIRKGNIWGDVGKIEVTPIATKAVNGRQIAFIAEPVVFKGNEHVFNTGMQARISAGTSFIATIANNYVFNVE